MHLDVGSLDRFGSTLVRLAGLLVDCMAYHKIKILVSRAEPSILQCLHRIDNHVENLGHRLCLANSDDDVNPLFPIVVTLLGKPPLVECYGKRCPPIARRRLHLDVTERRIIAPSKSTTVVAVTENRSRELSGSEVLSSVSPPVSLKPNTKRRSLETRRP